MARPTQNWKVTAPTAQNKKFRVDTSDFSVGSLVTMLGAIAGGFLGSLLFKKWQESRQAKNTPTPPKP